MLIETLPLLVLSLLIASFALAGLASLRGWIFFPFAWAWALVVLTGVPDLLDEPAHSAAIWRWIPIFVSPVLPFMWLAASLQFLGRRVPSWILPIALGYAALRLGLYMDGAQQTMSLLALAVDPSIVAWAAWLQWTRRESTTHTRTLTAISLFGLAVAEALDAVMDLSGPIVPWFGWVGIGIPAAALQILAAAYEMNSGRQAAERTVFQGEARLRAILSSLGDTFLAVMDRNARVSSLFGEEPGPRYRIERDEALGRGPSEFMQGADAEAAHEIVRRVFENNETQRLRQNLHLPAGEFWFDVAVSPVHGPSGEVVAALAAARDITQTVRAEEQQRAVQQRIQSSEKLESLAMLATGIAHDFNNLLASIQGNAELLSIAHPPDSPHQDSLRGIVASSRQGADLTAQLLAYAGQAEPAARLHDLAELARQVLPLLQTATDGAQQLTLEVSEEPLPVRADSSQLGRVMVALVTNASEASGPSDRIEVRIGRMHVTADVLQESALPDIPEGDYAYLEVRDEGEGMSADVQRRMFEPFFSTRFVGRGLGLAAVLGIVRGHNGTVQVESSLGHGTSVRVLLPIVE